MIRIKRLSWNKWKDYREIRLEALRKDPIAFGSSYEEEIGLSQKEWKRRIRNVRFAVQDDKIIGMIVYSFVARKKAKHISNIFGVYVKKEHRGIGIGEKMIENAISSIKKNKKIIKINLCVNPKQKSAVKLYTKCGFKRIGILRKDLYFQGKYYDEIIMEKFI